MIKIIAQHADGWNIAGINTVEEFESKKEYLVRECKLVGREENEGELPWRSKSRLRKT